MILNHWLLQWDVSSFMTTHWNFGFKLESTQKKQSGTNISIDQACKKFGSSLCNALPAFHAFTRCDYVAQLKRRRKVSFFKLLEKSTEARQVFIEIRAGDFVKEQHSWKNGEVSMLVIRKEEIRFNRSCQTPNVPGKI